MNFGITRVTNDGPFNFYELESIELEGISIYDFQGRIETLDYDPVRDLYWVGVLGEFQSRTEFFYGYSATTGEHLYSLYLAPNKQTYGFGRLLHYTDDQFILMNGRDTIQLVELNFDSGVNEWQSFE